MKLRIGVFAVLLLPALALAESDSCKYSEAHSLELDFSGVETLVFEIGPHELRLQGGADPDGLIQGRACASHEEYLERLVLSQERVGDQLIVRAEREGQLSSGFFGGRYARLVLSGEVPEDLMIELAVGSGDAWVSGVGELALTVGSGDADVRQVNGQLSMVVGSGDVEARNLGELHIGSIGSGEVEARRVRGAVKVGSIGSGEFDLDGAGGDVEIGSIGSGDADLRDVGGSVMVSTIGSGDLEVENLRGDLTVRSKGSGSVEYSGVDGAISIPGR